MNFLKQTGMTLYHVALSTAVLKTYVWAMPTQMKDTPEYLLAAIVLGAYTAHEIYDVWKAKA